MGRLFVLWVLFVAMIKILGPGATRTHGTRFRKPLLYPPELQGLGHKLLHDLVDIDQDARK